MNIFKKIAHVVSKPVTAPVRATAAVVGKTETLIALDRAGLKVADAAAPLAKSWHQSKTIWFNLVVAIIALVHVKGAPIPPEVVAVIAAVGNVILRILTFGPLKTLLWLAQYAADAPQPPAPTNENEGV